jgi:5'(3')-deoxyribonucleotidase
MKIWVDLDEVLAEFVECFLLYHNKINNTNYKKEDFFSYNFPDVYGWTKEENLQEVFDFQQSEYFPHIQPVIWALPVLERLKIDHELYIITSRQDYIQEQTRLRVDTHYPNIFENIYFTNDYSLEWTSRKKSDVCNELGIELMIDDSLIYAEDCASNERKIYLYNRPWNQSQPQSPLIQRIQDRNEIASLIML